MTKSRQPRFRVGQTFLSALSEDDALSFGRFHVARVFNPCVREAACPGRVRRGNTNCRRRRISVSQGRSCPSRQDVIFPGRTCIGSLIGRRPRVENPCHEKRRIPDAPGHKRVPPIRAASPREIRRTPGLLPANSAGTARATGTRRLRRGRGCEFRRPFL
jgi:hypothetical protein